MLDLHIISRDGCSWLRFVGWPRETMVWARKFELCSNAQTLKSRYGVGSLEMCIGPRLRSMRFRSIIKAKTIADSSALLWNENKTGVGEKNGHDNAG
jgi:hypothetical protein